MYKRNIQQFWKNKRNKKHEKMETTSEVDNWGGWKVVALEGKEIKREITLLAFPKILRCWFERRTKEIFSYPLIIRHLCCSKEHCIETEIEFFRVLFIPHRVETYRKICTWVWQNDEREFSIFRTPRSKDRVLINTKFHLCAAAQ